MKPYTCTALRIPHMEKIEIDTIKFEEEIYFKTGDDTPYPLSELRFISISNNGRIHPDYDNN